MRQTLLRIRLDDILSLSPVEGVTAVGLGYVVLVVWLLIAAMWALTTFRRSGLTRDDYPTIGLWIGSAAVVLALGHWIIPAAFDRFSLIGQISVDSDGGNKSVRINLGSADGVPLGKTFDVYPRPKLGTRGGDKKGAIEVVRIIGPHLAEATIVQMDFDRPFAEGDRVAWLQSIPVFGYGFMMCLGFISAAWVAARRADSIGVPGELIWDLAIWIMISGIGGARLFYVVKYPERIFAGKTGAAWFGAIFNLREGGLVLYGGVMLGLAAFFVFCRRRQVNPLLMADIVIPSVFIGMAFGRVGCFLNGCCYGDVCSIPWAVEFPKKSATFSAMVSHGFLDSSAVTTLPLHPTQLYSAVNALILVFLTAAYFKYRQRNGAVLALAVCVYPVTRFVIEYLRSDEATVSITVRTALFWGREVVAFVTPFTISQLVSLVLFVIGLLFVFWLNRRPAETALVDQ
jgi:phosphatidylglycerol:prolipoprotein diacylglycerol transferase